MHLDVTPSRRTALAEIESVIFHAKPGEPVHRHAEIPMNAFGFAGWYQNRTPAEERFAKAYNARLYEMYAALEAADPIVHDVPDQTPLTQKSVTTVALQLDQTLSRHLVCEPGRPISTLGNVVLPRWSCRHARNGIGRHGDPASSMDGESNRSG